MFLKSINLTNFRNYSGLSFKFKSNIMVLKGNNAQGKTNFLESIYFLATGKPIKTETDEEAIQLGRDLVKVEGVVESKNNKTEISTIIAKSDGYLKKRFLVNGIPRRLLDYSGNLVVVYFRPEDIDLVTASPGSRREYIDSTISQIDREYRKNLSSYQKIITQKNKLLKLIREGMAKREELFYWNSEQVRLGILLFEKRKEFFKTINSFEKKFGDFEYRYLPNEISSEKLFQILDREIQAVVSLIGPHRDDFCFYLSEKDLSKYGSRGEQRTAVLDLKITEASFFEKVLGERPLLLLDDIFSELDIFHRKHVLDLAILQQTVIATVEYDDHIKKALQNEQIFTVDKGLINL